MINSHYLIKKGGSLKMKNVILVNPVLMSAPPVRSKR